MTARAQIEKTFREEHGRVLAALISQLGDFTLAEDADSQNITAKYVDGVLQVSVPVIPGKQIPKQEIKIN